MKPSTDTVHPYYSYMFPENKVVCITKINLVCETDVRNLILKKELC